MKKHIKIFFIVMFILLCFGITTSKTLAVDVTVTTSQSTITNALDKNQKLIFKESSYNIYRKNPWIFCRQKGGYLRHFESEYTIEKRVEYPDGVNINTESGKTYENRYAIAYVFAYGKNKGYSKDDIQAAYWKLLGYPPTGTNGKNTYTYTDNAKKLHDNGVLYQNFKTQENNLKNGIGDVFKVVVNETCKTEIKESQLIYGPIKIYYAYSSDFGGFDFEVTGANATTSNVHLCIKSGEEYKNIDWGNDGIIRSSEWSGDDLYITVDLNEVNANKIDVKFKYNSVKNATAILYQIKGKHNQTGETTIYCEQCVGKMDNAINYKSANTKGQIVKYDGKYWKYESKLNLTSVFYNVNNKISLPKYVFTEEKKENVLVERRCQYRILC